MPAAPPRVTACPRCDTPVRGEFKFCPACAYRLTPGAAPPAPPILKPNVWPQLIVLVGALLLVGVILFFGWRLFREGGPAGVEPLPPVAEAPPEVLTVDEHLLDQMVFLSEGVGGIWPVEDRELPVYVASLKMSKFEVTRSMYAEFLEACRDHPEERPVDAHWFLSEPRRDHPEDVEYAEEHLRMWWEPVARHLEETVGHPVDRPADLSIPLHDDWLVMVMVPPSWTYITAYEEIRWKLPEGTENLPVTEVSYYDAQAFAEWARGRLKQEIRLPFQPEWIRAGLGGHVNWQYPWGETPTRYACNHLNYWGESDEPRLLPVAFRYSDFNGGLTTEGLYAMSGNAREWALDWQPELVRGDTPEEDYLRAVVTQATRERAKAPTMGGSFLRGIGDCTVTVLSQVLEDKRDRARDLGFRLAMDTVPFPGRR